MLNKGTTTPISSTAPMNDSATSPTSMVLSTIELLESIILQLPCKDVLLAQRVSKSWNATISGSLRLQKVFCFTPSQDMKSQSTYKKLKFGAWLTDDTKFVYPIDTSNLSAQDIYDLFITRGVLIMNPLFAHLITAHGGPTDGKFDYNAAKVVASNEASSWRKMQITHPPAIKVEFEWVLANLIVRQRMIFPRRTAMLPGKEGVKVPEVVKALGDLFDEGAGTRYGARFKISAVMK